MTVNNHPVADIRAAVSAAYERFHKRPCPADFIDCVERRLPDYFHQPFNQQNRNGGPDEKRI